MKKNLDKIRGCLIGGAAGDALGYAVEFLSEGRIFSRYGASGITEYTLEEGLARISDDTQMTLFTANGLLLGTTRGCMRGIQAPYPTYIARAYQEWYKTQVQSFSRTDRTKLLCWLMNVPELYDDRAPGSTCMSAIDNGCRGTIEEPTNHSKGCGGVMRVAPIGLYFGTGWTDPEVDSIGAEAAALTHGHELGYLPAALLTHIVRYVSQREDACLVDAVRSGLAALEALFPQAQYLPAFQQLIRKAVALAQEDIRDLDAIHALGQGWVGDEALAIAIYCALKYQEDFDRALVAAVNHGGDSDSTGAITGNILGAHLGLSRIPEKYTQNLELAEVILEIADDLYRDCPLEEDSDFREPENRRWMEKYITATYKREG